MDSEERLSRRSIVWFRKQLQNAATDHEREVLLRLLAGHQRLTQLTLKKPKSE